MNRLCLLLFLMAALACAQGGEALFAKTCGSGYCHATAGAGGGAPRLAARGFDADFIRTTVTSGVAGTQMAAYGASMAAKDLDAVVAYVASLNGVTSTGAPVSARKPALTGPAERGRVLFSDATRGFKRCSACHQVAGIGIAVAAPINKVPLNVAALKKLVTPQVATATYGGETMPILMIARRAQDVSFYDLTGAPPVLRTTAPAGVRISDGSPWSHADAMGGYSDAELATVLAYLRASITR